MAVYTDVEPEALGAFLEHYDIGRPMAFHGIAEGVENSNFLLVTNTGRFILTIYEKRVDPTDLPFFLGLMDHLALGGVACPRPVKGLDGEVLRDLCGKPAAIVTFLDGLSPRRRSSAKCRALGSAMASLHQAGRGFALQRTNALGPDGWPRLFAMSRASTAGMAKQLVAEIEGELERIVAAWPAGLPHGVIHADLFPDNAFFDGDSVSGIIDFYFACNDLLAYDVAIAINAWCFEPRGELNVTQAAALLDGYCAVRPMEHDEIAALPVLCSGSALRFYLTRLYDWLNQIEGALVKPHDPGEYLKKLRFHRYVRGPEAYGIN